MIEKTIFFLGIYTTRTHPVGIIVGTVTSQFILVLKIIGIFYFPQPAEIKDLTLRNNTQCSADYNVEVTLNFQQDTENDYPLWHKIFWISDIGWTAIYAMISMGLPCMFGFHRILLFYMFRLYCIEIYQGYVRI